MSAGISLRRPIYRQEDVDRCAKRKESEHLSLLSQVRVPRRVSTKGLWMCIQRRVPCFSWLPKYNFKVDFVSDVISGLTVGVMMIPQSMAYGSLAGLDAAHGLYTSFFAAIFYFLFGTSRHNSVGIVAVTSMMAASVRYRLAPYDFEYYASENRTSVNATLSNVTSDTQYTPSEVMAAVTFSTGLISIALALFRAGFLAVLISDQVSSAFTTAVALHVFTAQVDKLLNVKVGRYSGSGKLVKIYYDLFCNLRKTHVPTLVMSLISCALLYLTKYNLSPYCSKKYLKGVQIPADMILIVIATVLSYYMNLDAHGFKTVGHIPSGIPKPELPKLSIVSHTLVDGFTISIVIYCISISLAKIFAKRFGYKVDPEQEFFAMGATHLLSSFFACLPPCAAMARSSVLIGSGGRSQLCSIIAAIIVLLVIFFVGPLLRSLPQCILASIIIVALRNMIKQVTECATLWKISKHDFAIWIVTFLATILLDVTDGLAIGVCCAFLLFGFRFIGKKLSPTGALPDTNLFFERKKYSDLEEMNDIVTVIWKAPLFYGNAEFFEDQICQEIEKKWADFFKKEVDRTLRLQLEVDQKKVATSAESAGRFLIIDFTRVSLIDTPGVQALNEVARRAKKHGAKVYIGCCSEGIQKTIKRMVAYKESLKELTFFPSIYDAVMYAKLGGSPVSEIPPDNKLVAHY
uniref:STAS domain-containing protein n=1 Tax=Trichuris muris TaxID=70415 RepID=A0A5S6Q866_TRIMR